MEGDKKMKVAGVYYYDANLDPKIQHAVSEPYGLEKILAIAKQQGHDVEMFLPVEIGDSGLKIIGEEGIIEAVTNFNPDIVCFSLYTCQYPAGKRIAAEIKKRNKNVVNIAGNRYPSFLGNQLDEEFDFFVINEGEKTFSDLLRCFDVGGDFGNVSGVAYRNGAGAVLTRGRKRINSLDEFPNALRQDIILGQSYKGISIPSLKQEPKYAIIEYSRGCFGSCNFCDNEQVWGEKIRFRSVNRVIEEMFELKEKGVDIVYFMDLNFMAVPGRVERLCKAMIEEKLDMSWYAMGTIDSAFAFPNLLDVMKAAGCYKIAWGIESTSNQSLERMNKTHKGTVLESWMAVEVLEKALNVGLLNQGYYIIGFPWETAESILKDGEKIPELPLHQLNIGIFTPIPLSRFHDSLKDKVSSNLEQHDRNNLIYSHDSLTQSKVKELQKKLHKEFYESRLFMQRVETSCVIDPRFRESFLEYFEYTGVRV